jgi:enoyl-CoA hydratase/carnithine racemase
MQRSETITRLVLAERKERVLVVTLNRPDKLNALSKELLGQLAACLTEAEADPTLGCVVLTGAGRAFSAGADIADMLVRGVASYTDPERLESWRSVEAFSKPLLAAINGFAFGGGLELALLCDIALASETATFAFPEIRIGSFPGDGGTQRLPRLVGKSFAMQMILTGQTIDAQLAEHKGLISEVVPANRLVQRALEIANAVAANSVAVAPFAKRAVLAADRMALPEGLRLEHELTTEAFGLHDRTEGLRAFAEKRPPVFMGR